jgi:tetrahydromethanopterin S-methyltransferase subunit G
MSDEIKRIIDEIHAEVYRLAIEEVQEEIDTANSEESNTGLECDIEDLYDERESLYKQYTKCKITDEMCDSIGVNIEYVYGVSIGKMCVLLANVLKCHTMEKQKILEENDVMQSLFQDDTLSKCDMFYY